MELLIQGYDFHIVSIDDEEAGRVKLRVEAPHHHQVRVLHEVFTESGDGPLKPWPERAAAVVIRGGPRSDAREFPRPRLIRLDLGYTYPFLSSSCEAVLEFAFGEEG